MIFRTTPSQILYTASPAQDKIIFEPTLPVHNGYYLLIILSNSLLYISTVSVFLHKKPVANRDIFPPEKRTNCSDIRPGLTDFYGPVNNVHLCEK